jgi:phosphohistidine phosphatase
MKTLYLVRHAKSSWDDPDQPDFDRPLNDRGEKDAPAMSQRLLEKDVNPDMIYSSPAVRALTTAKIMASGLGYSEKKIKTDPVLYHAESEKLWKFVRNFHNECQRCMITGHNPGLTEFANDLMHETLDNIPTCGVVAIRLSIDHWSAVRKGDGHLLFFDYPKNS